MKDLKQTDEFLIQPYRSVINPSSNSLDIILGHYGYEQTQLAKPIVTSVEYPTYRLHYIVKGSVFFNYEGVQTTLHENTCFLLSPQAISSYQTNPANLATIFWVSFSGSDAQMVSSLMGFDDSAKGVIPLKASNKKQIISYFKDNFKPCQNEIKNFVLLKNFYRIVKLLYLVTNRETNTIEKKSTNALIAKTKKYIDANYTNPFLSIGDIASSLGVHKNYLSSIFKKKFGITFTQYVMQKRIEQAGYLLKETTFSVHAVAEMVGFLDPFYFSRVYKKFNKISPKQTQKQYKQSKLPPPQEKT